ncbi:hypothetical protein F4778DRAFT_466676 [Xylariomycetidae sp. FL2044]|nr:hypothetical protein F4778DRAFT_466676 [Xylariomycetidae sp. FL2044]
MLSHLRFHRRAPSNPTSPIPENSPWDTSSLQPTQLVPQDGVPAPDIRPRSSTAAPFAHGHGHGQPPPPQHASPPQQPQRQYQQPPTLPPITRVVSADSDLSLHPADLDSKSREEHRDMKPLPRSPYNEESGFIGGLALQNYRREQEALRPGASERNVATSPDSQPYQSPVSSMSSPPGRPAPTRANKTTSFVSPTDLHNATPATGKRPPGARIASEPQGFSAQTAIQEPPRGKKSLPFLKNPMSTLLLRRKTSQNLVPELSLPLTKQTQGPAYVPIRGTRVHDFSAPRPRRVVSSNVISGTGIDNAQQGGISPATGRESPEVEAPPVPPKDEHAKSIRTSSSTHSRSISVDAGITNLSQEPVASDALGEKKAIGNPEETRRKSSIPPSLASLSRNVSQASSREVLSALPKHMKSTSSRFSFDMIGAAKQEKLLEERHRQRQQEKKTDGTTGQRDSRFDDFDEDAFDYDAMDYDDGLEERIPGVNADLEEEDFDAANDPDNDQENFAGFVFSRSNPTSALTSPLSAGILPTPRDASGNVIGYAMTGETPELDRHSETSADELQDDPIEKLPEQQTPTGLGIQGFERIAEIPDPPTSKQDLPQQAQPPKVLEKDDELYFNDGLIHDFDGEGDGSAFDESIFDLNDTDRYGRPIPGMFAHALSQRNAAEQETKKRESDVTSRHSAQSAQSQSTAHTSVGPDVQSKPLGAGADETVAHQALPVSEEPAVLHSEGDQVAAYQAALAAAAHQAAASGKFRRDSSPPLPAELTITSPTTSGSSRDHSHPDAFDDYQYDDSADTGLDEYELDDDAIIAEANASALANDSDGWYGQEFGFYSAPASQGSHHSSSSSELSQQNLFQYSHGGYFGPSGVNRTTSGRVVSREPNLTPITERSEYSNRNSIMSLGIPPGPNSSNPLQSPGLAQLAMMADDDNMSLSALLRLRSKAWGGSQISLNSSRDASPSDRNGASSPWGQEQSGNGPSHGRKNSAFSIYSQDSTGQSASGSPTLTMSIPNVPNNAIPPLTVPPTPYSNPAVSPGSAPVFSPLPPSSACPPVFEDEETSPVSVTNKPTKVPVDSMSPTVGMSSQKRPRIGHRHKNSADSISYIQEEESGETRWILERRRTAESGEIEILGREVVDNGRI